MKPMLHLFSRIRSTMSISLATILAASFVTYSAMNILPEEKDGPSLDGATGWCNTRPLDLAQLRGKVVLIDFWTYTCINWRRTLPYVNAWAAKYKDKGLVVIGVHTPEFSFEQNKDNIDHAIREMGVSYPVAVDSEYKVWGAFENNYWPALYLIDSNGKIRFQKFGEGEYRESELMIQRLLKEVSPNDIPDKLVAVKANGFEAAADWQNVKSGENYVGYGNTQGFASPGGIAFDKQITYTIPSKLQLNQWALWGEWTIKKDRVLLTKRQGKLVYRFHARDLNLVMAPNIRGSVIKFRVLIDGKEPGLAHGLDINPDGLGLLNEPRMYQLIRQQGTIAEHEFQIEFLNENVNVYDFTFG